jgi:hypothetical protein
VLTDGNTVPATRNRKPDITTPGGRRADAPRIALTKIGAGSYALDVTGVGYPQCVQLPTAPARVSEE